MTVYRHAQVNMLTFSVLWRDDKKNNHRYYDGGDCSLGLAQGQ